MEKSTQMILARMVLNIKKSSEAVKMHPIFALIYPICPHIQILNRKIGLRDVTSRKEPAMMSMGEPSFLDL